jgi:hypothetical protein
VPTETDDNVNFTLGFLSLFLAVAGVISWWLAAHPVLVRDMFRTVGCHPLLSRAQKRCDHFIERIGGFLRPRGAYGVSLIAGLAIVILSTWVFGNVLQDVTAQAGVALLDTPVLRYFASHRVGWLSTVMQAVSCLGSGKLLLAVIIGGSLIFRRWEGSWLPLLLLVSVATGAVTLDVTVKFAEARVHPPAEWA